MWLHPVTEYDADFLYELLEQRPPEANISHRGMPTMEEHRAFIESDPYAAWYTVEALVGSPGFETPKKIGAVYLTRRDEIGVHILSEYRGRGYGRPAVQMLMERHPRERYLANISPMNEASQRLFRSLAFTLVQWTYERRMP